MNVLETPKESDHPKRRPGREIRNPYWLALITFVCGVFGCSVSNAVMGLLHDGPRPNPYGFAAAFAFTILIAMKLMPRKPDSGSSDDL